jgi:mannose-6-phosphate isomerase
MRTVEKPWGHELIWAHTSRYVGKILHIKRGESLSLQYHQVRRRDDHGARAESSASSTTARARRPRHTDLWNRTIPFHITPGLRHRMTALEDTDVVEVSTPELDDVVRLEDRYGRKGTSAA